MEMIIDFPGGSRVDAHFGAYTVKTDQPPAATAPSPFDTFLASTGTCAGFYVLGFCQQRKLPTEGIRLVERVHTDPSSGMVGKIDIEIQLPPTFPEKYRPAVVRSAEMCAVKKAIEYPPKFEVTTTTMHSSSFAPTLPDHQPK
jgi:putative redox protein